MFFLWLMFTSNLISQTTWLKVKLKLVNLNVQENVWSEQAYEHSAQNEHGV